MSSKKKEESGYGPKVHLLTIVVFHMLGIIIIITIIVFVFKCTHDPPNRHGISSKATLP